MSVSCAQPSARSSISSGKKARDYLDTVSPALAWNAEERRTRGAAFVQDQVLPRRSLAVDLTDRVHALTERQLEASSMEVGDLFSNFRTRLVLLLAFTLGIGLALAGSSLRRILALEREGETPLPADSPRAGRVEAPVVRASLGPGE